MPRSRSATGADVARYEFRAVRPLFVLAPFDVCGEPGIVGMVKLWSRGPDGFLSMEATATLR
jgi:3-methylfumaryl-CoA hydratase